MKKMAVWVLVAWTLVFSGCMGRGIDTIHQERDAEDYSVTMKRDMLCLMMAYSEYIERIELGKDDGVYLVMKSGRRILYDDKIKKNYDQKLNNPDIEDSMEEIYPLGGKITIMPENFDPGRIRHYDLLKEVYGGSRSQVESRLVSVKIGYARPNFNSSNKAASSLQKAASELEVLSQRNSKIRSCAFPINGTYNYRTVAGTNRLSAHAFGIALDLAVNKGDYWRWTTREQGQKRLESYPSEIVGAFEKNNFIWGGRWGHFDIMHFEYRPEIILKARYSGDKDRDWNHWYDGFPVEDKKVREYINAIEKVLGKY